MKSTLMNLPEKLARLIGDLANPIDVGRVTQEALEADIEPNVIAKSRLGEGIVIAGEKYETGQYFLADLIMAATLMVSIL